MSHNQLADIPVDTFTVVCVVCRTMSHNQLADIPVDTFTVVCVVLCAGQ